MSPVPSSTSTGNRPVKVVSEAVRERETFKYEPFLFSDFRFNHSGVPFASSELSTSNDRVLTALAQLGTYQTGTERAFISLFDTSHQYVIAEATPSISLAPGLPSDDCSTPLSLCGTAIPRSHGTCEHVLYAAEDPKSDQSHDAAELPLSLVRDLTADPRFSSKPYCQFGESGQFYAAVPIRTGRGIDIGAYCVLSSTKVEYWDGQCTRYLRDISHAIMEHIEANRSKHAHRRNERMNRGLGSFIEGKSTLSGWQSGPNVAAFMDNSEFEGAIDTTQQHLERNHREKEVELESEMTASTASTDGTSGLWSSTLPERPNEAPVAGFFSPLRKSSGRHNVGRPINTSDPGQIEESNPGGSGTSGVFSKAANIIREAFEVAGCLFFNVTLGSYRAPTVQSPLVERDVDEATSQLSSTSNSDEQLPMSPVEKPDASCELLGFSTSDASSVNAAEFNRGEGLMPKRFLAKLLRRYPNGKIFNFDAVGELQTTDSPEDDGTLEALTEVSSTHRSLGRSDSTTARVQQPGRRFRRIREGALIRQTFPAARSVAFVPVWDLRRERWFAGGFVYTLTHMRVFTVEGELSFLKAFANLVATEVYNLETLQADKAKSDALDSLSHELRSPLHGVILGTELLNDTDLSVFQGNATHTIETCCRTLLDTIDHLLDYSKVNSVAAKRKQEASATPPKLRGRAGSDQSGKKLYSNARLDRLIEEVAESIFAGYNFQHMSVRQLSKQGRSTTHATRAHNRLDTAQAMEQLGPNFDGEGEHGLHFGNVSVYVSIDPTGDWMFNLPAGAIRRIVINLFGNSLKYTARGAIRISLSQEKTSAKRLKEERIVKLTVQDSGKGIGEDYLRHKLFKPFAQEDELALGTGLGLSLVKTLLSQLRGRIFVESQVGVGTTITVTLPLEQSSQAIDLSPDDREFEEHVRELKGIRVRLSGFESRGSRAGIADGRAIVEDICRNSLHLDLVSNEQAQQLTPDLVLWSDDALPDSFEKIAQLSKTPNVVVCQDALVAYRRFTTYEFVGQSSILEFISQPIGPRKLAKSIQLAYKRWMGLPKMLSPLRPPGPERSHSLFGVQKPTEETLLEPEKLTVKDKILLVDDNNINLKILSACMRKLGRSYEAVTNGKEAVDAYTQNPGHFAGVLMDISMPVMDGLEATRRIRAFEHGNQLRAVSILALTGLTSDSAHQVSRRELYGKEEKVTKKE
ncbi:hypothetical protein HIM_08395 [Hirsutella minnesotensis 3608]|uniref:Histidine kinase n=1 Tax=Hirsutella minnesotensis 3608 TaxID=1043627 RepID=A0A0F7ZT01_9HYPO|nr:hypothetical protein HIM_08395 [Hirsutella minnesotensis 3608]